MSEVFFSRFNDANFESRTEQFQNLIYKTGIRFLKDGQSAAVKLHFGEPGCTTYIKPDYIRVLVGYLTSQGAKPFLTDTTTLYSGPRRNRKDHERVAVEHGFSEEFIGAPTIIADGDNSSYVFKEHLNLKHFQSITLGKALLDAESLIVVSHFKGHMVCGFGGAIKNLGMGFGSRAAKQRMHADVKPKLKDENSCSCCGICVETCAYKAVVLLEGAPHFDYGLCKGCAECITKCPEGALKIQWDGDPAHVMEKTAETAYAALKRKRDKSIFYNFLTDITPDCDCVPWSKKPLVEDIGILMSRDPVAIDAASLHLITQAHGLKVFGVKPGFDTGQDKFKAIRPDIDGSQVIDYAELIGLGSGDFKIIEI